VRVVHDIKFTLFQYLTHFWLGFVFSKLSNGPHSFLKLQLKNSIPSGCSKRCQLHFLRVHMQICVLKREE
jgi:hypothetical protein